MKAVFTLAIWVSVLLGLSEAFGARASDLSLTVSGGGVTAKATYLNPNTNAEPRFEVTLDTHSVALDGYDLKTIAVLRDDAGKEYLPAMVENKGGGHHRGVTLTFPKLSPSARHVEMVIKDVAGVKERTFRWDLE